MRPITTTEFLSRPGSRFSNKDAQLIGPVLSRLSDDRKATAEGILEEARPDDSEIHPYFEWNDAVAAEEYRKDQARHMAASIEIILIPLEEPTRAFPAVKLNDDDPNRHYTSMSEVVLDNRLLDQCVAEARRNLMAWQKRFQQLRAFSPALEAVAQSIEAVDWEAGKETVSV